MEGSATGLATMAAEELDADWAQVRYEFAPADASRYKNHKLRSARCRQFDVRPGCMDADARGRSRGARHVSQCRWRTMAGSSGEN